MAIVEVIFVLTVSVMAGLLFYSASQQRQQQMQLENAFYQLLEAQDSCISLIQLTASARVDVPLAKQYLDRQVQMYGVLPEVDADGDTLYRFPKLKRDSSSDKN